MESLTMVKLLELKMYAVKYLFPVTRNKNLIVIRHLTK